MNQQGQITIRGPLYWQANAANSSSGPQAKSLINDGVFIDSPYPLDKAFQKKDTHFFHLKIYGCPIF